MILPNCKDWFMPHKVSDDLGEIRRKLDRLEFQVIESSEMRIAAVTLILTELDSQPQVLFIQRAISEDDPWSGQIAFPGGGVEQSDASLMHAAIREAEEEVGLVLQQDQVSARLNDIQGRNNNRNIDLVISCFVFISTNAAAQEPRPNCEVGEVFWIPLQRLSDPQYAFDLQTTYRELPYPAIDLGTGKAGQPRILWGLTYRFVQHFQSALGLPTDPNRFD